MSDKYIITERVVREWSNERDALLRDLADLSAKNAKLQAENQRLQDKNVVMRVTLDSIAIQLNRWADESIKGGWSTHQVDPMRKLATDIRAALA